MFFCKKEKIDWDDWDKKYPIGKKFNYLGTQLIVKKNWGVWPGCDIYRAVLANYKDNNGIIREIELSRFECNSLEEL